MMISIVLFRGVVNNPSFKDIPIYLIMNKKDLFEQQVRKLGQGITIIMWLLSYYSKISVNKKYTKQVHTGDVRQYFDEFDGDVKDTREVSYFTVVMSRILLGRESFELNLTCK